MLAAPFRGPVGARAGEDAGPARSMAERFWCSTKEMAALTPSNKIAESERTELCHVQTLTHDVVAADCHLPGCIEVELYGLLFVTCAGGAGCRQSSAARPSVAFENQASRLVQHWLS